MNSGAERFYINSEVDLAGANLWAMHADLLADATAADRVVIATIIAELGSNIVKYGVRGVIGVARVARGEVVDIEIRAEDKGPGIANLARAMSDHYSTGGTLGMGLPGVQRMADAFSIHSPPEGGTQVFASKRIRGARVAAASQMVAAMPAQPPVCWSVSVRTQARLGEHAIGDVGLAIEVDAGVLLAIIDASGHGKRAGAVADRLAATLREGASSDLVEVMKSLFHTAEGTLGAAVGLAFVDPDANEFRYLGVGNTRCVKLSKTMWRGVSRDGVLGERWPTPYEQRASLVANDCLVLWTDGIAEDAVHKLLGTASLRSAQNIAQRLMIESARPYDDAGCVVLKWHK